MLFFVIIMVFILFVIFILPKYKRKKTYQNTSFKTNSKQYQNSKTDTLLALTFHSKTETVNLFGHTVSNAYFYTCELMSYIPFAINVHSKPDFSAVSPEKLNFPPNYNEMDNARQGGYIKWLADGKPAVEEMNDDMGYVYLYYYGLEYRTLVEKQNQKEILFEVIDLIAKFKKLRYGFDFIIYLTLAINNFSAEESERLIQFFRENKQKYCNNSAYSTILKNLLPRKEFKTEFSPAQLCPDKEQEKLTARQKELLDYYLVHALEKMNDTDIFTSQKQIYKYYMAMKASSCIDVISPNAISYDALIPSQKVIKLCARAEQILKEEIKKSIKNFANSAAPLTEIEKFLFLPETLKKEITPPAPFDFTDSVIANIESIAEKLGFSIEENITLRQSALIADACEALGYEIEPSAELEKKAYKKGETVILYENQFIKKSPSELYQTASLFADLGYQTAIEDNEILPAESMVIEKFIKKQFSLSQAELYRLQMRGKLIAQTQKIHTADTIKKLLKTANSSAKETIIRFVLAIAGNDGVIKEKEYKLLQKIAGQLSITEEQLKTIIAEFIDTASQAVVLEKISSKTQKNSQDSAAKPEETIKLQLNAEKLAKVQINTAEIHTVLQEIFGEEQAETLKAEPKEDTVSEENKQNQPENELQNIIALLLEKESWTRNELMNIIQNKGLMLNSLLDQINEWAENTYGDFLIEEDDDMYAINSDVAELIKQNK